MQFYYFIVYILVIFGDIQNYTDTEAQTAPTTGESPIGLAPPQAWHCGASNAETCGPACTAFKLTILAIRLWSGASRQLWQTPAERHGDAFGASASTSSRPHTAAHAIHHGTSVWISTMYMDRRRRARNQVPLPDPNRESSGNNRKTGRIGANHPEEEAMPLNTDKQNRRGNGQRLRRRSSPKTAMARRHWIHHGNQRHLQHCLRHQWSIRVPQQNGRCFRSLFMP